MAKKQGQLKYDPAQIEPKWQEKWEKEKIYKALDFEGKPKQYILIEFPYPSGERLHVGHGRSYSAMDAYSRHLRMKGCNVMFPFGWDAFGLPAENYAIKTGINPQVTTKKNIDNARKQVKQWGLSFDWDREINTTDPDYYKWTQWIFVKLFEKNLAYKAEMSVGWCPSCKTILANEEIVDSKCERCGAQAERRMQSQWMLKITEYAQRLIDDLAKVDYLPKIKIQQENWIGRAESTEVDFPIKGVEGKIKVVTTRPDTIFGATFLVLAPEHPLIEKIKGKIKNYDEVEKYIQQATQKTDFERGLLAKDKTGVKLEGLTVTNPANNKEIPVYISDFVLISYGTGAIMAVPAHDDRDFEFAKKFKLPIVGVIQRPKDPKFLSAYLYDEDNSETTLALRKISKPQEYATPTVRVHHIEVSQLGKIINILKKGKVGTDDDYKKIKEGNDFTLEISPKTITFVSVYADDGKHVNSDFINGMYQEEAIKTMDNWLKEKKLGGRAIYYHLRDWVFSRQHYWGEPIPMVDCKKCGWVPVPEEDLPVKLPYLEKYQPTGTGESPLAQAQDWLKVACPKCGQEARRETDTMPNWAGSNWYFLRYCDPKNSTELADRKKLDYWMPVELYNGGMEHTTLHLLYSRFIHKFLFDIKVVSTPEPYARRHSHGVVLGSDGQKMSKSKGNVINPDEVVKDWGADTFRLYEMFMGPFEQMIAWDEEGVGGTNRFLRRVWQLTSEKVKNEETPENLNSSLQKTVKKVTTDLEKLKFNTAIASMMEFINEWSAPDNFLNKKEAMIFLQLLAPFAPHVTEELWESLGGKFSIHVSPWPKFNPGQVKTEQSTVVIQINGKLRETIETSNQKAKNQAEMEKMAKEKEKIKKIIGGKKIKKVIFVPGKLLNFVV